MFWYQNTFNCCNLDILSWHYYHISTDATSITLCPLAMHTDSTTNSRDHHQALGYEQLLDPDVTLR